MSQVQVQILEPGPGDQPGFLKSSLVGMKGGKPGARAAGSQEEPSAGVLVQDGGEGAGGGLERGKTGRRTGRGQENVA